MLRGKRLIPFAFLFGLMIYGPGSSGCSCDDGASPKVTNDPCGGTCALGKQCNATTGMCDSITANNGSNNATNNPTNNGNGTCAADGDCAAEEYCGADSMCATGCRVGGCDAGELCDTATHACFAACVADANEPNEDAATQTVLTFTAGTPLASDGLTLCADDIDRFAFDVLEGQELAILIEGLSTSDGNLKATLFDGDGAEVMADADTRDIELRATALLAGTWAVQIEHGNRAGDVTYDLTLLVQDGGGVTCTADLYEPNDTSGTAESLDLEYGETKDLANLSLCEADVDQYSLMAAAGDTLTVSFDPVPADGLAVRVVNADTNTDVFNASVADTNAIELTLEAGEYIVVVEPAGTVGEEGLDYGMRFLLDAAALGCVDDALEDNDVCEQARNVAAPGVTERILCAEDSADWFAVFVPGGSDATINAVYANRTQGALTMVIYAGNCSNAEVIASPGTCGGRDCELSGTLSPAADTTYLVQIQSADITDFIQYDLAVDISGCAPDLCEPNNTRGDACTLQTNCRTRANICPNDLDFYCFNVGAAETFSIAVHHFRIQSGDVDLTLVNSSGTAVDTSWTTADCEDVSNASATGDTMYCLKVEAADFGGSNDEYRIVFGATCAEPETQVLPICQ